MARPKKRNKVNSLDHSREEMLDQEIVIGRHPASEVLKSDRSINKVFLQEGLSGEKIGRLYGLAKERGLQVDYVPKSKLDQLSNQKNHQGIIVMASPVPYVEVEDLFKRADQAGAPPFFILLDELEDPHNLGSIMRTADAVGVHGIIIPKRRSAKLTATVSKASAGAIEHVPVARVSNMSQTIKELKERGLWIFGTDLKGTDYRHWKVDSPVGLVIGNEGSGISRLVKENVDEMLTIPMEGNVQSLNASVAASVLMYEVFRKRNPL